MINPSSLRRVFALVVVLSILLLAPAVPAQEQSEEMKIVVAAEQFVNQQKPDEALAEIPPTLPPNRIVRQRGNLQFI